MARNLSTTPMCHGAVWWRYVKFETKFMKDAEIVQKKFKNRIPQSCFELWQGVFTGHC